LRRSITATALSLTAVLAWVGAQSLPSSEAVRLRNALLFEAPAETVGAWLPGDEPPDFLAERREVPVLIAEPARRAAAAQQGELERSRALVAHLLANARDNTPIAAIDIERTYRGIVEDGRGYCSDYIDAFVALALATGIPVRTWAFSFDGFGGYGHVVAEVYDRTLRQWVMLDVFNNVQPLTADGRPLAARDFRARFADKPALVNFARIGAGRMPYHRDDKLREYYSNGIDQWYLWNGNNVITRSEASPYRVLAPAPGAAELLAIALGDHPRLVPLATATNAPLIERMNVLGRRLRFALVLIAVLTIALVVQSAWWLRRSRRQRS
jgi:hypothetical protein